MSPDHLRAPMTGLRVIDHDGAAWPITGSRCLVCKMPRDPAVADSIHPGCRPSQPVSDQAEARLIGHLATSLGARLDRNPTEGEPLT